MTTNTHTDAQSSGWVTEPTTLTLPPSGRAITKWFLPEAPEDGQLPYTLSEVGRNDNGAWLLALDDEHPRPQLGCYPMVMEVLELTQQAKPAVVYAANGSKVFVYRGHLVYGNHIFITPGLFSHKFVDLTISSTKSELLLSLHDLGFCFSVAVRPDVASVLAVQYWLGAAWRWLPELRQYVLGADYAPSKEVLDPFGRMINAPYTAGAQCNA